MNALTALHTRNSINRLTEPAPNPQQLDAILKAGVRACDHAGLRPWQFHIFEKNARHQLAQFFVDSQHETPSTEAEEKLRQKPFRAPTIITVIADTQTHKKVPEIEQLLSAGAAAQMMMVAAHAQGLGAIWRSGSLMFSGKLHRFLQLNAQQKIVGFIYIGSIECAKPTPACDYEDVVKFW